MCENLFTRDYFHTLYRYLKEIFILEIFVLYNTYFAVCPINPEHNFDIVTMPYASLRILSYTKADLYKIENTLGKGL